MPASARLRAFAAATTLLAVAGCSSLQSSDQNFLGLLTPYRIDIVQGNVVTRELMSQVSAGMTKAQVRAVLGSPLLADPFHAERWDYVFYIRRQGAELQRRNIVLTFDGDRLKTIDAPELPSEREFVAAISTVKSGGSVPTLALSDEQRAALPKPAPAASAPDAAPPTGPQRDYPPLEAAPR